MSPQLAAITVTGAPIHAKMIEVVVASSEAVARARLTRLLENEHDMILIAEAYDLDSARQHVRDHHPDVVVLALDAGGRPTLDALKMLFSEANDTRYVVMNIEQVEEQDALSDAIRLATSSDPASSRSC